MKILLDTHTFLWYTLHHRDPFDRMIITQGIIDDWTVASIDGNFPKYNIPLVWE